MTFPSGDVKRFALAYWEQAARLNQFYASVVFDYRKDRFAFKSHRFWKNFLVGVLLESSWRWVDKNEGLSWFTGLSVATLYLHPVYQNLDYLQVSQKLETDQQPDPREKTLANP